MHSHLESTNLQITRVTSFIRGDEGIKLQKNLWKGTLGVMREHIGESQLDQLLGNLKWGTSP
jgi:hypothetical protein